MSSPAVPKPGQPSTTSALPLEKLTTPVMCHNVFAVAGRGPIFVARVSACQLPVPGTRYRMLVSSPCRMEKIDEAKGEMGPTRSAWCQGEKWEQG